MYARGVSALAAGFVAGSLLNDKRCDSRQSTSSRIDALNTRISVLDATLRPAKTAWVCGEVLIDRLPPATPGGERINVVGGGAANTAKALARLGMPVEFIDGLSSDVYGVMAKADLANDNVGLSMCLQSDQPTCLATVSVDGQGKASYEFLIEDTATFAFSPSWLPDAAVHKPAVLHIGTLGTIIAPGSDVIYEWAAAARSEQGVPIVFDPNVRPSVVPDRDAYRASVEKFAAISDIVKASDEDMEWLYPGVSLIDIARQWLEADATSLVVITRGDQGAMSVAKNGNVISEAAVKIQVVDTVGAGDTVGAILVEAVTQVGVAALVSDSDRLRATLRRANCASGVTCSRAGCQPPTQSELQ
jgi:fructokinase